jgi:hypothetical protein
MAITTLGPNEINKLQDIIFDGVRNLEECEALQTGMADTIKSVAEELQIPASLLKKAIKTAFKGNYAELEAELNDLDALLQAAGKK